MQWKKLELVVGASTLAGLLAGCTAPQTTTPTQASSTVPSANSSSPATSSTPSASAAGTPSTSTPSPSTRVDPNAPAGQCADASLKVSVQADGELSGAGQAGSFVVFRNTGTQNCVLRGAPGVSLVGDNNGTQVGAAAARATGGTAVTIAPGSYAVALLTYPNVDKNGGAYGDGAGHDPKCEAKPVDGYRVYPPHSFRAFFSGAKDLYGCSTQLQALRVLTVQPASKYPYFRPSS